MGEQRGPGCGCNTVAMVMFSLAIFTLVGSGIYVFRKLPEWGDKAVPYLESKGRAFLGVVALYPAFTLIDSSDLSEDEKEQRRTFMLQKWEIAYKDSTSVPREKMIDEARGLVNTLPGYYYAFRYMRDECVDRSSMGERTRKKAKKLFTDVMTDLEEGNYSLEQMRPIYGKVVIVISDWSTTSKKEDGRTEEDSRLRDICRYLYRLHKEKVYEGDKVAHNMDGEFRELLEEMEEKILNTVDPFAADATPVPQDRKAKAAETLLGAVPIFEKSPPAKSDSEVIQQPVPKSERLREKSPNGRQK